MKIFEETGVEVKKSWSLKLISEDEEIRLVAVDSTTGVHVCYILVFMENGIIRKSQFCTGKIMAQGYDVVEHGNDFDDNGSIIIQD